MINLFYPEIDESAGAAVADVLRTRWIGQGPKVDEFEEAFRQRFYPTKHVVAVSSGTAALHLAYILAGITAGSRVITPVFTCTATNTPLLHLGARLSFADIDQETMNISAESVYNLVTTSTKAVVAVHYGGAVANVKAIRSYVGARPIIEDAAQCLGVDGVGVHGNYVCHSFQAIKHLTTGDGGALVVNTAVEANVARRLRWFGIDRKAKLEDRWVNDIKEAGFKYQLTDLAASIGLANLQKLDERLAYRKELLKYYVDQLRGSHARVVAEEQILKSEHAAWICTVVVNNAAGLQARLAEEGIESNPTHYRNDRYSIFKDAEHFNLGNMDELDGRYLLLPLHARVTPKDVKHICRIVKSWC